MEQVSVKILKNNIKLITNYNPYVESVVCGVWASTGSRNEQQNLNGISHFLEHMAFKGTTTKTYTDIAEKIEDIGGDFNAFTSRENTFYYTKTLKEYLPTSIEILADIIQNSIFDKTETNKERNVILQEYYNSLDTPDDIIYDYYYENIYKNQALGRMIIGSEETIKSITPEMLKNYITENYTTDNLYFVVSGNFNEAQAIELTEKYFDKINRATKPKTIEPGIYTGGYKIYEKDLEQTHFILGFESNKITDQRETITEIILATILGGGMSSRLFQEIREKQNLVYTIYASCNNHIDTGNFYIYSCTSPDKINSVINATTTEIKKFLLKGITDKELLRAKAMSKASLLMSLEKPMSRAISLCKQLQFKNKIIPLNETINKIESITKNDIISIAQNIFKTDISVVALGNSKNIYDKDKIENLLRN